MKNTLDKLRSEIKTLAAEGCELQRQITALRLLPDTGPERHKLRLVKRGVGERTRARLVAYGVLRGVPYVRIEANCRVPLDPALVLSRIKDAAATHVLNDRGGHTTTVSAEVQAWITDYFAALMSRETKIEEVAAL